MMCVNSKDPIDKEAIEVNEMKLESTESEVYLGSVITDSQKFITDVEADIKKRRIRL